MGSIDGLSHGPDIPDGVTNGTTYSDDTGDFETDVLVIGGGFGGMYSIYKMRQLGLKVKLIEAGSDYGGTWHWNRYPGARVDSETPFYQLSIPEIWKTWTWTERFPGHEELRRYFSYAAKVLDLRKDSIFNTVVTSTTYESDDHHWVCKTSTNRTVRCKYLILATGSSYKKHYPDFKNMSRYKGELMHSALFPDQPIETSNKKKIAVIGNGATGVQIVQDLAKTDCQLTAYIRTPNIALPMRQRPLTAEEQDSSKGFYTALFAAQKTCRSGFPYNTTDKSIWEASEAERTALFEELWSRGGFSFLLGNYRDFLVDKKANAIFYDFWCSKVRARMNNKAKADVVAPVKQRNWLGTKRPSLEQDYYEMLDRDNVEIVDLNAHPLVEFTETGIVTGTDDEKQNRTFDTVILATGYDSLTGSLLDLHITDRNHQPLSSKWEKGVETYLGLTISGMPNLFMVYSPQAPTSLSNGPPIIEIQVDWIAAAIEKMKQENIAAIDAQAQAAKKWREDIQVMNSRTLYPLENSWYMGANIPGKVREQLVYLGGVDLYNKTCFEALDGWKGFDVIKA